MQTGDNRDYTKQSMVCPLISVDGLFGLQVSHLGNLQLLPPQHINFICIPHWQVRQIQSLNTSYVASRFNIPLSPCIMDHLQQNVMRCSRIAKTRETVKVGIDSIELFSVQPCIPFHYTLLWEKICWAHGVCTPNSFILSSLYFFPLCCSYISWVMTCLYSCYCNVMSFV